MNGMIAYQFLDLPLPAVPPSLLIPRPMTKSCTRSKAPGRFRVASP